MVVAPELIGFRPPVPLFPYARKSRLSILRRLLDQIIAAAGSGIVPLSQHEPAARRGMADTPSPQHYLRRHQHRRGTTRVGAPGSRWWSRHFRYWHHGVTAWRLGCTLPYVLAG